MKKFSGSADDNFEMSLVRRTVETLWRPAEMDADRRAKELSAALIALVAFKPQDEIEGMLAAEAVALHAASMECLRRAMIPEQGFEPAREYRKAGANLARAFTEILDALDRKRGKGRPQIVRVERVTVQPGGQAIVGNVTSGADAGGGGRHGTEIEDEPRAPRARLAVDAAPGAVLPALRGQDTEWKPVPVAGDARQGPLPDARRKKHRPAHR
jgi:hypothetical protein